MGVHPFVDGAAKVDYNPLDKEVISSPGMKDKITNKNVSVGSLHDMLGNSPLTSNLQSFDSNMEQPVDIRSQLNNDLKPNSKAGLFKLFENRQKDALHETLELQTENESMHDSNGDLLDTAQLSDIDQIDNTQIDRLQKDGLLDETVHEGDSLTGSMDSSEDQETLNKKLEMLSKMDPLGSLAQQSLSLEDQKQANLLKQLKLKHEMEALDQLEDNPSMTQGSLNAMENNQSTMLKQEPEHVITLSDLRAKNKHPLESESQDLEGQSLTSTSKISDTNEQLDNHQNLDTNEQLDIHQNLDTNEKLSKNQKLTSSPQTLEDEESEISLSKLANHKDPKLENEQHSPDQLESVSGKQQLANSQGSELEDSQHTQTIINGPLVHVEIHNHNEAPRLKESDDFMMNSKNINMEDLHTNGLSNIELPKEISEMINLPIEQEHTMVSKTDNQETLPILMSDVNMMEQVGLAPIMTDDEKSTVLRAHLKSGKFQKDPELEDEMRNYLEVMNPTPPEDEKKLKFTPKLQEFNSKRYSPKFKGTPPGEVPKGVLTVVAKKEKNGNVMGVQNLNHVVYDKRQFNHNSSEKVNLKPMTSHFMKTKVLKSYLMI